MNNKIKIPEYVNQVLFALYKNGFEAYLVGGCVRDSLLLKCPQDYDIATDASPEKMKKCFEEFKVIETGIKHGTLTVISDGRFVEVTTFRIDGEYSDSRHPDEVLFTKNLKEDLSRRDFTINAMAFSEKTGLVDYFGGIKDLSLQTIRAVGEPQKRFEEDALRIMRALRFSAVLGFEIEKSTSEAAFRLKDKLKNIAAERLSQELIKLITGDNCYSVLMEYAEILGAFIPEILPCINFDQHNKYHKYSVWEHIVVAVAVSKKDRIIRLAMLFHDISKPSCFTIDEKGQGHFKTHEKLSAVKAEEILKRLRFDSDTIKRVCLLIELHYFVPQTDEKGNPSEKQIRRLLSKTGEEAFFQLVDVQRADNSAKQGFCMDRMAVLDKMEQKAKEIIEKGKCFSLKNLEINGNDLIRAGLSGKEIGTALDFVLNKVIDGEIQNEREVLLKCLFDNNFVN